MSTLESGNLYEEIDCYSSKDVGYTTIEDTTLADFAQEEQVSESMCIGSERRDSANRDDIADLQTNL